MAGHIPPEVFSLLNNPDGRFLLVKGSAGTGKSMFCLELVRECGGLYVSTRVKAERLYQDCPGLEESVPPDFILDAAVELDETVLADFLTKTKSEGVLVTKAAARPGLIGELSLPPLFDRILQKIEVAQIPFVVVIDSWDAVFAFAGASKQEGRAAWSRAELRTLVLNVFRGRNVNLVMVEEGDEDSQLEFLVDGVIELKRQKWNERVVRVMDLRKLRGTEIVHPEYLFTLHGGRFQYFEPFVPKIPARPRPWNAMPDTDSRFSSGSEDLDRFLGGGFRKGTTVLLEMGSNVPDAALEQILTQVSDNFIAQGRGIIMVPPGGLDVDSLAQRGYRDIGEVEFNSLFRLIEKGGGPMTRDRPYVVMLKFDNLRQDFNDWMYIYNALRKRTGGPILEIVGIDTQEARYGEEVYKEFLSVSSELTRKEGNLTIRITRPGMDGLTRRCANVSDIHMKLIELNGAVLIYMDKPRSGLYYMDTEAGGGNIRITLQPLV